MKKVCKSIQSIALITLFISAAVALFAPVACYVTAAAMIVLAFAAIAEPEAEPACPMIFTKQYHDHYYSAA